MITKQNLTDAKALISDPEHWTQGWEAVSNEGSYLKDARDPKACKWCTIGAIAKVMNKAFGSDIQDQLKKQNLDHFGVDFIWVYNDNHTHAEVMVMFDGLIERAP